MLDIPQHCRRVVGTHSAIMLLFKAGSEHLEDNIGFPIAINHDTTSHITVNNALPIVCGGLDSYVKSANAWLYPLIFCAIASRQNCVEAVTHIYIDERAHWLSIESLACSKRTLIVHCALAAAAATSE